MRKILFACLALTACADDRAMPPGGDDSGDDGGGGDGGDGGGGGGGGGGDDGVSTADRQQDLDDVATSIGANLAHGELAVMIDSINMAFGRMPPGFAISDQASFLLVEGARGELAIQYEVFCRDTVDAFAPCDGFEHHAHVNLSYSGRLAGSTAMMDGVERVAAWTVRDLASPTPRVGGDGTDAFASKLSTGTYAIVVNDTLNRVLFDPTPSAPVGGSIDLQISVQRTRASASPASRTFDVDVRIDFAGGDTATITLDGVHTYRLTLSTGVVVN